MALTTPPLTPGAKPIGTAPAPGAPHPLAHKAASKPAAVPGKKTKEQLRGLPPSAKELAKKAAADSAAKLADEEAAPVGETPEAKQARLRAAAAAKK